MYKDDKIKVMLVEDDRFMQGVLNEYLSTGYKLKSFANGIDAMLELQNGWLPDLIISDLNIPGISGIELINQLKSSDFFNAIPVLVLSGEESSAKRVSCLNAGADDFLIKPFNPLELEARIQVILRRNGKAVVQKTNL